jgi:outer membrane protein OmpA-like peptidoglycan-associated protein
MSMHLIYRQLALALGATGTIFLATPVQPQVPPPLRIVVNSNQDGAIQPDGQLTLREAIALANGSLTLEQLSDAEKTQVSPANEPRIDFNLPADQTTIQLTEELPPLARPGLTLDGTTQPGYSPQQVINELPLAAPVVALTPAEGKEIFRGLTIVVDGVTVRGLSIYGFASLHDRTASTPPADIFISHRLPPPNISKQRTPANFSVFYNDDVPPKDVVIENNWLGVSPNSKTKTAPGNRSTFGVYVFHGIGTVVRRNWIGDHDGSAVITSVNAEGLQVIENVILGNGVAGMPDGIRLEGQVNQSLIASNLMCGNDGAGVYLFKPDGAVQIRDNQIVYNGRRLRRGAVYLMGSNHQVVDNQISFQAGPGVVVAAYPKSQQNRIQNNRFIGLEGLSIDLVTWDDTGVFDYQKGDGPNPPRNTFNRLKDTGNAAINAPQFVSPDFLVLGEGKPVQVFGVADPGSQIDVYQVTLGEEDEAALSQPIASSKSDDKGNFAVTLDNVKVGDRLSAIATHPDYGTSEPSPVVRLRSLDASQDPPAPRAPSSVPSCTTAYTPPPAPEPPPPAEPIRLQVPNQIHFALDKDIISPASAKILDRVAAVLRENPTILIDLEGHTDPRASDAYNLDLGRRRAQSARNYLLRKGVAPERMTIRSFGERRRRTQGSTRIDYARDRRVEILFRDARNIDVIIQEDDLQIEGGGR